MDAILAMSRLAFPDVPDARHWTRDQLEAHLRIFPQGQWVFEDEAGLAGSCFNMRTTWQRATAPHTWHEITGGGRLRTHDEAGDVLYGTEIMVHPRARRRGIGRLLLDRRISHVMEHGLRAFATGGRLPGYHHHASTLMPWQYVQRVASDELIDPVLTPELRWGLTPRGILCGYMEDPPSLHHATLVVWENPEWAG